MFVVLEIANIRLGTYEYYGPQPLRLAGFPVWIALGNTAICMVMGVGAHRLGHVLPGRKVWTLLLLGPPVIAAGLIGTGFPTLTVLHLAHPQTWLIYVSVIWSTALAGTMTWLATQFGPGRERPVRELAAPAAKKVDAVPV
jgi:hypothetical protein